MISLHLIKKFDILVKEALICWHESRCRTKIKLLCAAINFGSLLIITIIIQLSVSARQFSST